MYEEALKEGDRRANEALPQATLDCYSFDFGPVKFLDPRVKTLTISNVGRLPVEFKFRPLPGQKEFCPPYLTITPNLSRIETNKQVVYQSFYSYCSMMTIIYTLDELLYSVW